MLLQRGGEHIALSHVLHELKMLSLAARSELKVYRVAFAPGSLTLVHERAHAVFCHFISMPFRTDPLKLFSWRALFRARPSQEQLLLN